MSDDSSRSNLVPTTDASLFVEQFRRKAYTLLEQVFEKIGGNFDATMEHDFHDLIGTVDVFIMRGQLPRPSQDLFSDEILVRSHNFVTAQCAKLLAFAFEVRELSSDSHAGPAICAAVDRLHHQLENLRCDLLNPR